MTHINQYLSSLAHNYFLISIAAVVFFTIKAIAAYLSYRHYNKKLKFIQDTLEELNIKVTEVKKD
ncbi:hypothetical protein ACN6MY_10740 [Peribacillus sp. B-H-3]|jgi:hypothetical protein|uniref:hypothetical protein n=1 Tax=Peribacillus sp. B-H-3 TaxID=3400420 RepID=UPI003B0199C7